MGRPGAVGVGVAWRWATLYAALCFVTQIWAGSQHSPGQGGGLMELVAWAGAFGVVVVVAAVERELNGSRVIDPGAILRVAVAGHVVGTVIAFAWFTSKNGPSRGDWWVAPAVAAVFVIAWVHLLAPRRSA